MGTQLARIAKAGKNSSVSDDTRCPFVELVKENTEYKMLFETRLEYEVRIVRGVSTSLHWYVLLKIKNSDYSYITFEITTTKPALKDLIPLVRVDPHKQRNINSISEVVGSHKQRHINSISEVVGIYKGSVKDISCMADEIVDSMGSYDLIERNCQNFCNILLTDKMKLRKDVYPTTIYVLHSFDNFNKLFDTLPVVLEQELTSQLPTTVQQWPKAMGETRIRFMASGPPQMDHLIPITQILRPMTNKWQYIGTILNITQENLDEIERECYSRPGECLHELLLRYLKNGGSHCELAQAMKKVGGNYSQELLKLRS